MCVNVITELCMRGTGGKHCVGVVWEASRVRLLNLAGRTIPYSRKPRRQKSLAHWCPAEKILADRVFTQNEIKVQQKSWQQKTWQTDHQSPTSTALNLQIDR